MPEKTKKSIQKLQTLVKDKFGKPLNSVKSFEELSLETKVSVQTLRRFYNRIDKNKGVSMSSLSVIAKYAGFLDFDDFLSWQQERDRVLREDKIFIENMSLFLESGQRRNCEYPQESLISDMLNGLARVVYRTRENTEFFYNLYKENNWATDYVLAWLPNYNLFGQKWFRKILKDKISRTENSLVKLSQKNFLHLGTLFRGETAASFDEVKKHYHAYKKEYDYMPYHEMRFHTILLIEAHEKGDSLEYKRIINDYLNSLEKQKFDHLQKQELIVFFSNTLLWLQDYETAWKLMVLVKPLLENLISKEREGMSLHYFGINSAFVKTTFALSAAALLIKEHETFDLRPSDFQDQTGLLYNTYIQVQYLACRILKESGLAHKKKLFSELKTIVDLSGYRQIFNILKNLDPLYRQYSA